MQNPNSENRSSRVFEDALSLEFPVWDGDFPPLPQDEAIQASFAHARMLLPMMMPEILEKRNALMNPERFVLD